jgi:hypothetical protein
MKRFKKFLLVFVVTVIAIAVLVIAFISPIAKYLIEKYDDRYTGRRITLSWAYVNPFTGYIHLHGLKVYEQHSDTVFLAADGLSVRFGLLRFFRHGMEIKKTDTGSPGHLRGAGRQKAEF